MYTYTIRDMPGKIYVSNGPPVVVVNAREPTRGK